MSGYPSRINVISIYYVMKFDNYKLTTSNRHPQGRIVEIDLIPHIYLLQIVVVQG